MNGAPPIPLGVMLWISLATLAGGVVALVPIWWRGRMHRLGRTDGVDQTDVDQRNIACALLTGGGVGLIGVALVAASRAMPFGLFMVVAGAWIALVLAIALAVDARARRHR